MISTELHTLHNPHDVTLAGIAGLPPIDPNGELCANCGAAVGSTDEKFVPLSLALSETHHWVLCLKCSMPSIKPRR